MKLTRLVLVPVLSCVLLVGSTTVAGGQFGPADLRTLDDVEERSESVANRLLELSVAVRNRNVAKVAAFFTPSALIGGMPATPEEEQPSVRWMRAHGWVRTPEATLTRSAIAGQWQEFLGHLKHLEDVRFKVKSASFSGAVGNVTFKYFLIGRDRQQRREWIRGTGTMQVVHDGSLWLISRMRFESVDSSVATEELFDEVSGPAGLSAHAALPSREDVRSGRVNLYGVPGYFAGAAAGDLDNDGSLDLVVTGARGTFVYMNRGDGTFDERAQLLGVKPSHSAWTALLLDYDNDGDTDIFLSSIGKQMLFENRLMQDGRLSFRDVSEASGVSLEAVGYSAVAGDVNGDGLPDIYVCSYNRPDIVTVDNLYDATNGTPNLLFLNEGNGHFKEAAREAGVADTRWSFAAEIVDIDGDGAQDIVVSNDFSEDAVYLNDSPKGGKLHFRDVARERGVDGPGFGMGISVGDYNNDGLLDLHETFMSSTAGNRILSRFGGKPVLDDLPDLSRRAAGNRLYRGIGDGHFEDVTAKVGPFPAGWAWGGGFVDFDNDGWSDLHSVNGMYSDKEMKDT